MFFKTNKSNFWINFNCFVGTIVVKQVKSFLNFITVECKQNSLAEIEIGLLGEKSPTLSPVNHNTRRKADEMGM